MQAVLKDLLIGDVIKLISDYARRLPHVWSDPPPLDEYGQNLYRLDDDGSTAVYDGTPYKSLDRAVRSRHKLADGCLQWTIEVQTCRRFAVGFDGPAGRHYELYIGEPVDVNPAYADFYIESETVIDVSVVIKSADVRTVPPFTAADGLQRPLTPPEFGLVWLSGCPTNNSIYSLADVTVRRNDVVIRTIENVPNVDELIPYVFCSRGRVRFLPSDK